MPIVHGTLAAVNTVPTEGTVTVRSLMLRSGGAVVITGEPKTEPIRGGEFTISLVSGPCVFTLAGDGVTHTVTANVPDTNAATDEVDFVDLIDDITQWSPEIVNSARQAARDAEMAARTAAESATEVAGAVAVIGSAERILQAEERSTQSAHEAENAASQATTSATDAAVHATAGRDQANRAKAEADRAKDEADRADSRATVADASAGSAAADAAATASDATATAADRTATGQARTQAWSAADRADTAATTATIQADRAKTEADRAAEAAENVDTAAIRQEVTTQIAAVVDGAPEDLDTIREVAEYAQENRTITDTLNAAIGQKADKTHTHTVSDVTGLQGALDGKAPTSHTHTADQVTMTADNGQAVSVQEVIVGLVEALPTAPEVTIVPVDTMPPAAEQLPGTLYIRYGGA